MTFVWLACSAAAVLSAQQPQPGAASGTSAPSASARTTAAAPTVTQTIALPATNTAPVTTSSGGATQAKADDLSVKGIYLVLTVVLAVIAVVLYFWKGMHWAAFTPLDSAAGGERLRKIIEGELSKNPEALMKIILRELDNDAGHKVIADYVVRHWQTEVGRAELLKLILVTQIIERAPTVRAEAKDRADEAVEALSYALRQMTTLAAAGLRNSEQERNVEQEVKRTAIGATLADDPAGVDGEAIVVDVVKSVAQHEKKKGQ